MTDLRALAASLPSMGGVEIGGLLERLAGEVGKDQTIVEVGCWLGAGTAHLALGARESRVPIYCYDRWVANAEQVAHAAGFGVTLQEGENTLPRVMDALRPFGVKVGFRRGDIRHARWPGGSIGLYVDDASKAEAVWQRSAATFLPHVPVGGVAVLMDFHFQPEGKGPLAQVAWMLERPETWRLEIDRPAGTTAAVFRRSS